MTTSDTASLGEWSENAERLVPRGAVEWVRGPLGYAGSVSGKPVAAVRKTNGQWIARIEGWQWHVTPDMGVSRFDQIPGGTTRLIPAKVFSTAKLAQAEVQQIMKA